MVSPAPCSWERKGERGPGRRASSPDPSELTPGLDGRMSSVLSRWVVVCLALLRWSPSLEYQW